MKISADVRRQSATIAEQAAKPLPQSSPATLSPPAPHFPRTTDRTLSADRFGARETEPVAGCSDESVAANRGDWLAECLVRGRRRLLDLQQVDGHWCGELEGDSILQSEFILLEAWLGRLDNAEVQAAARHLLRQQAPHGGWSQFPGGALDISASVKAYFALKLTGHDPRSEAMRRARRAIREAGGADAVNSFTRFYLALLDQISYDYCPSVPPEAVLLPKSFPLNMYRISAWSRTIFVPLSIMWAHRPVRQLPPELGIQELFLRPADQWPALHCPGREAPRGSWSWEAFFRHVDAGWKWLDRWGIRPLRRRALRQAEHWILERFEDSDGLGAIFPSIIWSIVALKCLGYEDDGEEIAECHRQLRDLMIHEGDTTRLQPCKSPVWDTALALRALAALDDGDRQNLSRESPAVAHRPARRAVAGDAPAARAAHWLLDKEVRRPGDWSVNVDAEPGGWFFEYRNVFYPDVDDTIMVMMALRESSFHPADTAGERAGLAGPLDRGRPSPGEIAAACERARRWTLAMQNRDGGWGAFDRDNDCEILCRVPFADHNAMIDPSTPDITGRVIEALGKWGMGVGDAAVDRAIAYLRRTQETDGSWIGRWGVNYIYGTWQVLVGLVEAGVPQDDPAVVNGANWLLRHQCPSGGWGESAESYARPELRGRGPETPSQTAWALLGLLAAGYADHPAVGRGAAWLRQQQQPDGGWLETEFTGTGFPLVFYLRYHLYPLYFPLMALARYAAASGGPTLVPHEPAAEATQPAGRGRGNGNGRE